MGFCEFLTALQETGVVQVTVEPGLHESDWPAIAAQLAEMSALYRQNLAFDPPEFCEAAGVWAAATMYRACGFYVFRDVPAEAVAGGLLPSLPVGLVPPDTPPASVAASVDVVMQFLPDLFQLARHAAKDDPLVAALRELGRAWPLSSVGIPGIDPPPNGPAIDAVAGNRSLLQLYADRIIERHDCTRVADSRVDAAVRAAIGGFPQLAPAMAAHLGLA